MSGSRFRLTPKGFRVDSGSQPPRGRTPAAAFRAALLSIAANPKAAAFGIVVLLRPMRG